MWGQSDNSCLTSSSEHIICWNTTKWNVWMLGFTFMNLISAFLNFLSNSKHFIHILRENKWIDQQETKKTTKIFFTLQYFSIKICRSLSHFILDGVQFHIGTSMTQIHGRFPIERKNMKRVEFWCEISEIRQWLNSIYKWSFNFIQTCATIHTAGNLLNKYTKKNHINDSWW